MNVTTDHVFNETMTSEEYVEIMKKAKVGDIIHIDGNWMTIMRRVDEAKMKGCCENFDVYPINPGTSLFTTYGADNLIVTKI